MPLNHAQPSPSAVPARPTHPALSLIVLTNFLPAGRRAIRHAAELAAPLGAQLVLLHVREVSVLDGELLTTRPDDNGDLLAAVQTLADEVYVPTTVELVPDLQPATAADLARRYSPALFVLGRAATPAAAGEVSEAVLEVLRGSEFPLLVVPETYRGPVVPTQVMLAADGDPFVLQKGAPAVQLLAQIAPDLTVVTVSACEDDQACATALRQAKTSGLVAAARHAAPETIRHDSPAEGLLEAVAQTKAELVVLVARRRSFLGTMFHRSVTSRLLRSCPVPLLLLPATDE